MVFLTPRQELVSSHPHVFIMILWDSMNFHPVKQLFLVARAGDWTADALPLHHGDSPWNCVIGEPPVFGFTRQQFVSSLQSIKMKAPRLYYIVNSSFWRSVYTSVSKNIFSYTVLHKSKSFSKISLRNIFCVAELPVI